MKRRMILVGIVCLALVGFSVGYVAAAPACCDQSMMNEKPMMHQDMMMKNIMMSADKFLKMSPDMAYYRYDVKDLKMKVDSGMNDFIILDVRPATAFAMEHIPMAMNIPLPMVIDQLSMIPMDKTIYVVCAVDSNSSYATAVLRMLGYNAYMVPGGEGAWKSMNYPVTMGM